MVIVTFMVTIQRKPDSAPTDEPKAAASGGASVTAKPPSDGAKEPEEPRGGKFVLKPPKVFNSYELSEFVYVFSYWIQVSVNRPPYLGFCLKIKAGF